MTDRIPTPEDNVTELKPRQKPGPKPKAAPAPKPVEAPLVPSGSNIFDGVPFAGGFQVENARENYSSWADRWSEWNNQRNNAGVLGIDGILIELAYKAAATGSAAALHELQDAAYEALAAVEVAE